MIKGKKPILTISLGAPPNPTNDHLMHNYRLKFERLYAEGKIHVLLGSRNNIDVGHDDGCGVYRGGFCDCDPDIYWNGRLVS